MTEVIASTKDRPGSYDAIETAKPGEPLFPIQGGDPFGPPTVLHWASLARKAGIACEDEKEAKHLLQKATDAETIAWQMQDYQRGVTPTEQRDDARKAREATRPSYSGWTDLTDGETLELRQQREWRIDAVGRTHNALAIANDVAEGLAKMRCCPESEVLMREAVEKLREAARGIEPRRGNERS